MAASNHAKKKLSALEEENKALKAKVDDLLKVNERQLQRLTGYELTRMRVRELEEQLSNKGK